MPVDLEGRQSSHLGIVGDRGASKHNGAICVIPSTKPGGPIGAGGDRRTRREFYHMYGTLVKSNITYTPKLTIHVGRHSTGNVYFLRTYEMFGWSGAACYF